MKNSKEHNERRNEILDVAGRLFGTKGYDKSTVNDILTAVGIAKGTFYYYFKSKEEVLDAIIERVAETVVTTAQEVVSSNHSPVMKLFHIILSMKVESELDHELMEELHKPENALMHQKSLNLMVTRITPLLVQVVEEGIKEGTFKTEFPTQYMQIFLTSSITLLDDGIFKVKPEEQLMMLRAMVALLEKMLGMEDEDLWNIAKQYWG